MASKYTSLFSQEDFAGGEKKKLLVRILIWKAVQDWRPLQHATHHSLSITPGGESSRDVPGETWT